MQELFLTLTQDEWAIRALIASSLVGIMCGTIGSFIVLRNMSLIGDALAHAILPGIFVAFILVGYSTIGFFLGSVIAGLLTAVIITWIQHNVKTKNDAAIGIVFTAMFSIGVIGISKVSTGDGVHLDLKDFLFGTVLGISNEDIYLTLAITIYSIISIIIFYRYLFITTFQPTIAQTMGISVKMIHYFLMLLLSFAVVSSLRAVGVILVVAMLITPASTALLLSDKLKNVIILSGFIGFLSAVLGLILAISLGGGIAPGPTMCVTATFIYFMAVVFSPKKGLLTKFILRRKQRSKIEQEDIIKHLIKNRQGSITMASISAALELPIHSIKKHVKKLAIDGAVNQSGDQLMLSIKGNESGDSLVRAHRLWETYLVDEVGLEEGQIHTEAEKYEHFLTEDVLDEVDARLGYPTKDPHGSPIPQKQIKPQNPLLQLRLKSKARIAKQQITEHIESELWELGLTPNMEFRIHKIGDDHIILQTNDQKIKVHEELARQINVLV